MSKDGQRKILEAIFRRKGGNGVYTRLIENMDPEQHSALSNKIEPRPMEQLVIGSLLGPSNWFVLTTDRLVWSLGVERHEVTVESIRDASANFRQVGSSEGKLGIRTLRLTTLAGDEHTIELEPGPPLSGVWNVLKHLGRRNRHASGG